jgi:ketosteroid isomerase-like protein
MNYKQTFIILIMSTFSATIASGQVPASEQIQQTIMQFASAADSQDPAVMERILDPNFQVIMNRLFGSETVTVMNKTTYVAKIRNKEFGGDKREVTIGSISVNGTTAYAVVTFKGSKMTFVSTLLLVQNAGGEWKLVTDLPNII